jgi:nucleoside-diphosphate-sugar epimerase
MKVAVTGACGWTANPILEALVEAGHQIIAFDLPGVACPPNVAQLVDEIRRGDVADFQQVRRALEGTQAAIHLAVTTDQGAYRAPDIPFAVNVKGAYNLFESARRQNLARVVLVSSAPVHLPLSAEERLDPVTDWKSSAGSDHLYDLCKRLQEEIAKDFCATFGMTAIVLRAGHVVNGRLGVDRRGRPLRTLQYCRGGWVCRYDLARVSVKALEATLTGYNAYHVIGSERARKPFDIERTERELGFVFENRFEAWR